MALGPGGFGVQLGPSAIGSLRRGQDAAGRHEPRRCPGGPAKLQLLDLLEAAVKQSEISRDF